MYANQSTDNDSENNEEMLISDSEDEEDSTSASTLTSHVAFDNVSWQLFRLVWKQMIEVQISFYKIDKVFPEFIWVFFIWSI